MSGSATCCALPQNNAQAASPRSRPAAGSSAGRRRDLRARLPACGGAWHSRGIWDRVVLLGIGRLEIGLAKSIGPLSWLRPRGCWQHFGNRHRPHAWPPTYGFRAGLLRHHLSASGEELGKCALSASSQCAEQRAGGPGNTCRSSATRPAPGCCVRDRCIRLLEHGDKLPELVPGDAKPACVSDCLGSGLTLAAAARRKGLRSDERARSGDRATSQPPAESHRSAAWASNILGKGNHRAGPVP